MDTAVVDQETLSTALARAELVELGRTLYTGMPSSPNHPGFTMALMRRHGDMVRADGSSAANEIIVTGGHVGTHVDALAHVSYEGCLHGGVDAAQAQTGGRFSTMGADEVPPMLGRGLFLDVAAARGVDVLPGGYGVTAADLAGILDAAGLEPRAGDVAVVRTGWGRYWSEPERYAGHESGVPGISPDAAGWLVEHGFRAVGTDTTACEQLAPGAGHSLLPVHKILLVDAGIHILEHLALEDMAGAGVVGFSFVMAPLRIVGATGSPIRPLAVIAR